MLNDKRLDSWIQAGLNILLVGAHGIGKTERVIEAMKRNNKKYLYFSASTMDPFTDFVGIPRVVESNGIRHIDFVKPLQVAAGDFEYLVIDEYNRAHKKVRNAMMECVQFKSINGVPFPNLKGIIAMINPPDDDDTYDVDKLDPAQEDRFQIKVVLPNGPSKDFFKSKHGDLGEIAVAWWNQIDAKFRAKGLVSPRRLDYAVDLYKKNIDIEDVLPKEVNIKQLKTELAKAGLTSRLPILKAMSNKDMKKEIATNGNLRELVINRICEGDFPIGAIDILNDEEIINNITNSRFKDYLVKQISAGTPQYMELGTTIASYSNSSSGFKEAATAIGRAIVAAEQAKLKKASAEERIAGMSLEEVKRALGELAKPTVDEKIARETITTHLESIKKDATLRSMVARISDIRPVANIKEISKQLGIKLD